MMRPADNARTIALKSELLARGITRDEARIYLNALSGPDSIPSPDDCQAAARLWLPHFIACSPVLDPAQSWGRLVECPEGRWKGTPRASDNLGGPAGGAQEGRGQKNQASV